MAVYDGGGPTCFGILWRHPDNGRIQIPNNTNGNGKPSWTRTRSTWQNERHVLVCVLVCIKYREYLMVA